MLTSSPNLINEPNEPYPPRFWWLKRLFILSVLLTIAFIAALKWWRDEAERRLAAEIAALRAAGQPVLFEDFDVAPIPDENNAAATLKSAGAAITMTQNERDFVDNFDRDALDSNSVLKMLQIERNNTTALQRVRTARSQNGVDWGVKLRPPAINLFFPALRTQRELGSLISYIATAEHASGADGQAIARAHDLVHQSDAMQQHPGGLIPHLIAIAMSAVASDTVRVISYDLMISEKPGSATRQQVSSLIAELLHDTEYRRGLTLAMYGERLLEYDVVANPTSQSGVFGAAASFGGIFRPMFTLDVLWLMRRTTMLAKVGQAPNYPAAMSLIPTTPQAQAPASAHTQMLSRILLTSLDRTVLTHFRGLSERRISALRLAIRMYQLDHGGELPQRLEELSPDYIPNLPADPFAADGRTFGYRRSPEPLLYSVGENGVDEGCDTTLLDPSKSTTDPAGMPRDRFQWQRRDVIFPLSKPVPASQPASDVN